MIEGFATSESTERFAKNSSAPATHPWNQERILSISELIINAFSEISFRASLLNIISTFSDLIKAV